MLAPTSQIVTGPVERRHHHRDARPADPLQGRIFIWQAATIAPVLPAEITASALPSAAAPPSSDRAVPLLPEGLDRVLAHPHHLTRVNDGQPPVRRAQAQLRQFRPNPLLHADQYELIRRFRSARCLHRPRHDLAGGVVTAHRVDPDPHVTISSRFQLQLRPRIYVTTVVARRVRQLRLAALRAFRQVHRLQARGGCAVCFDATSTFSLPAT